MLLYEVTATVQQDLIEAFEHYMCERHISDVLATGAFQRAVFARAEPGRYHTCYEAASRSALDRYLTEHAPGLRADFASHFPNGIELARETWDVVRMMTTARAAASDDRPPSPIACRMDALSAEQRTRRAEVLSVLKARLATTDPTPDGIVFRWSDDRDGTILPLLGEFVALESRCCPFLHFRVEAHAEGGPVDLHMAGREGVKDFLVTTFMRSKRA